VSVNRRLGQHFLQSAWVAKFVGLFQPQAGDHVLEIGPGRGAVTLPLAGRVARLVAIEIDRHLARSLGERLPESVHLVVADVLEVDLGEVIRSSLAPPVRVVGNLPYRIAAPILFRLLAAADDGRAIREAMVMVQREVAERLVAKPGTADYGVLAILVQWLADPAIVLRLPPGAFRPPPKVDSAVVRLTFRPPSVRPADPERFETMVRGLFAYRRKTVANALRHWTSATALQVGRVLAASGIDPRRRPETLHLSELARLSDVFASARDGAVL
jgi:16S rRNA (adenine1518-N6/adenine1519-N6)-dimethyltransferase